LRDNPTRNAHSYTAGRIHVDLLQSNFIKRVCELVIVPSQAIGSVCVDLDEASLCAVHTSELVMKNDVEHNGDPRSEPERG
jgi:hypothetical protein